MSTQIAVRLPDDVVAYIDARVRDGVAPSRAALITKALERDRRRALAERDAAILAAASDPDFDPDFDADFDPDFDALARFVVAIPMDDLD